MNYQHLQVLGCRAFVHIPSDEMTNLDGKSHQCIFIRHGDEKFGYL